MNEVRAKVIGWTDGGSADRFEDEYGCHWRYFTDDCNDIAVHRCDDAGTVNGAGAGYFDWDANSEDGGFIRVAAESSTFGVNCDGEFMVRGGEWRIMEEVLGNVTMAE